MLSTTFIVEIGLICIVVFSCIIVTYQFWNNKESPINKLFKHLCMVTEFFCVIAINGLAVLIIYMADCNRIGTDAPLTYIIGGMGFLSYSFTLTSLYAIFAFRVYSSFVGSIYHLSKKTIKQLISIFIIQFAFNIGGVSFYYVNEAIGLAITSFTFVK